MVMGFALVKAAPGHELSVRSDLQRLTGVEEVYQLFGEFSFFLVMVAEARIELIQLMEAIKEMDLVSGTGPLMQAMDGGLGTWKIIYPGISAK
jgi:hypothetical protein